MTRAAYLRPPWWMRAIGNRVAPRASKGLVATLSVPGRVSGDWRTTPVVVLEENGERYLLAPFGDTDWSRNLRVAKIGRLTRRGKTEQITAVEVPTEKRGPLIDAYLREYGRMPNVAASFRELPYPADHPTFHISTHRPQ